MLKTHSLKLLKENGKIPVLSDVFSFCWGGRMAGVVVCPLRGDRVFLFFLETHFPRNILHQLYLHHPGSSCAVAASLAWKDGAKVIAQNVGWRIPPSSSSSSLAVFAIPVEEALCFFTSIWCENRKIAWPGPQISGASFNALVDILTHTILPSLLQLYLQETGTNILSTWVSGDTRKARHMGTLAQGMLSRVAFIKHNSTFPLTSWSPIQYQPLWACNLLCCK